MSRELVIGWATTTNPAGNSFGNMPLVRTWPGELAIAVQ
jgi:hypothetical protein